MSSQKGQDITVKLEAKEAKDIIIRAEITGVLIVDWNGDVKIKLHNKRSVENLKVAIDKLDFIYETFGQNNESNKK